MEEGGVRRASTVHGSARSARCVTPWDILVSEAGELVGVDLNDRLAGDSYDLGDRMGYEKFLLHFALGLFMISDCQNEGGGREWRPHREGRKSQEDGTQKGFR